MITNFSTEFENEITQKYPQAEIVRCGGFMCGYHVKFPNSITASIQCGRGTYSDNHYNLSDMFDLIGVMSEEPNESLYESHTAEIAAWYTPTGDWVKFEGWNDDVNGYQTVDEVLAWLDTTSKM